MKLYLLCLVFFILISSCSTLNKKPTKAYLKANPSMPIKINGTSATPKQSTEFHSLIKSDADTLAIEVASTYVYFPFGIIKGKTNPNLHLLKNFKITNEIIKTDIGDIDLQILKHGSSKLIFFFNPAYSGKESDLYKGEIYDTDVKFINGIKIGMSIDDFYKCFFDYFPSNLKNKYKYFVVEAVDGIKHTYSFKNDTLKSVKFSTGTYWKLVGNP